MMTQWAIFRFSFSPAAAAPAWDATKRCFRSATKPYSNACWVKHGISRQRPFIVGRRDLYSRYGEVIEDIIPGCGPLGGIHATLRLTETDLNLVLSVDIPKVTPLFLRWMADTASNNDAVVTVPQANGRLQPLCAVYRRSALGAVEGELQAGNFKVTGVFAHLPTRVIAESELAAAGFALDMFDNVNTPADYNAVTGRYAQASAVREHRS